MNQNPNAVKVTLDDGRTVECHAYRFEVIQ